VNWGELFSDRRTWAVIGAKLLSDLGWFFLLFFMPDFFARVFHMKQATLGGPTALAYSFAALGALSSGLLFPILLNRGWSMNRSRKTSMFFYACMILPMPLAIYAPNPWAAAAIIGVALFAHQGFSTNVFGMTADAVPVARVATVVGAGAVAGNLSGAGMIWFAGYSLSTGLGYWPMFAICASAYLLALLWIHIMLPVIRPAHD
jgi:MFS transporter, ACS family, hexuronate transporter